VTPPPPGPTDDDLLEVLRPVFADRVVTSFERRPFAYASSYSLQELRVCFADGRDAALIFKDLAWDRMLNQAQEHKPSFLYEPRRSIETHRRILAPEGIGPCCYAAVAEPERSRYWLFLEKISGPRISKVADFGPWEAVTDWLARFHARFADRVPQVRAANPFLLEYGSELYLRWCDRALRALGDSDDPRASALARRLGRYDETARALAALPSTFVHGEFYPHNVLVEFTGPDVRVYPVDWEVSGTGPGLLDLAALTGGKWDACERERFLSAYRAAMLDLGVAIAPYDQMLVDFDRCRLHLALQWLGWSVGFRAPPGRAQDWLGVAFATARQLDI
jgi:hypothetical protein